MDFLDKITQETLIICQENTKKEITKIKKLLPIKVLTLKEFKENYFFQYNENTILYIMKKYLLKYNIAKAYIDNLYYIENKLYNNPKLDYLVSIKKELDDNNLLIYNHDFKNYLNRVQIITYNINLDNNIKKILEKFKYKEINDKKNNYNHEVYAFDTMEEEINYVAYEIAKLIDSGINPKNIKLMNVDSSYDNTLERIFNNYNLKPGIKYKRSLSSYKITKDFIKLYKDNTIEDSLKKIDKTDKIYPELVKIINKYLSYDDKELIIFKLNNTYITSNTYEEEISLIDYLDYVPSDNNYYFLIGFNETLIPKYYMDIDYITDNIKKILDLKTTKELNIELTNTIINNIHNTKNLIITYKLKDNTNNYYPSTLIKHFKEKRIDTINQISYSKTYNEISLAKEYDNFIKYGTISNLLNILNNNYEINYNSYSNKYKKVNINHDKLYLSYSKLDTYNNCSFKYYLANILKLDIYEENFAATIGSMVHFIMEKCLTNNNEDVDKYSNEFLKDKVLTNKELFFIEKYKEEIKNLLEETKLEKTYSKLDKAMYEKKINITYDNNTYFTGIIDKILYCEDKLNTYIALIDYKTGNDEIDLKYLNTGINIQLPIYLYLVSKLDFKNPIYIGFYLQKFNIIEKDYRLVGYSNSDKEVLSYIDNNYQKSKIIKGLKINEDGSFGKNSKVLSTKEIKNIIEKTDNIIKETIANIKNNKFDINPKVINDKCVACQYCKFKDICFKTPEDETTISLGGDEYEIYS